MVDATPSDLQPITHPVSSTSFPASSVKSTEKSKTIEDSSPRSLSPVLNTNNAYRRSVYNRKRSKSRIKLTKRFASSHNTECDKIQNEVVPNTLSIQEDYINKTISEIQNCNQVGDRLIKIKELEKEKKKLLGNLYVPKETKTYVSDRKPRRNNTFDEFNFKKPDSPVCIKKIKSNIEDVKAIGTNINAKERDWIEVNKIDNAINIKESYLKFQGFCTGSGKNILISPESLNKNVEIFRDILNIEALDVDTNLDEKNIQIDNRQDTIKNCTKNEPKDISFMQTSITDTQLMLAADVALEIMDNNELVAANMRYHDDLLNTNINSERNDNKFKGFTISECNFAQNYFNKYCKFIENMENLIKCCSNLVVGWNGEEKVNILETNLADSNNFQEVTDLRTLNRNGKHPLDMISTVPSKRCKFNKEFEYGASKESIKMLPSSIKKAQSIVDNLDSTSNLQGIQELNEGEFLKKTEERNYSPGGFSTAGGKTIKISGNALEKVKSVFSDEELVIQNDEFEELIMKDEMLGCNTKISGFAEEEEVSSSCVGRFTTRNGMKIKISKSALKKSEKLFSVEGLASELQHEGVPTPTINAWKNNTVDGQGDSLCAGGFTTGSGNKIKISKSALLKSKNIFADEDFVSELQHEAELRDNLNSLKNNSGEWRGSSASTGGFTTGSGNKIQISKSALLKSKNIFADEDFASKLQHEAELRDSLNSLKNNIVEWKGSSASTGGFTTGSGNKIKISKSALLKSKNIFADEDFVSELQHEAELRDSLNSLKNNSGEWKGSSASTGGFTTGSGNKIKISKSALLKSKNIFSDEDFVSKLQHEAELRDSLNSLKNNSGEWKGSSASTGGFTTGSGNKIKISKSALLKSKNIFADEDFISKLQHEAELRDSLNSLKNNSGEWKGSSASTDGFTTGSGNKIKISKSALLKSKNIFADEDFASKLQHEAELRDSLNSLKNNSGEWKGSSASTGGFTTGSGNKIQISKSALLKSKNIFADEDFASKLQHEAELRDSLNSLKNNIVEWKGSSASSGGFTTGNGMKIKISESALQRSKNIFTDEDFSSCLRQEEVACTAHESEADWPKPMQEYHENNKQSNNQEHNPRSFTESSQENCKLRQVKSMQRPRDSPKVSKKRLGLSACKQIIISNDKLQKAKSILEEDSDCGGGSKNTNLNTPVRFKQAELHSSTPLKDVGGIKSSDFEPKGAKMIKLENTEITPVKKSFSNENIKESVLKNENKSMIIIQEQTESDIKSRLEAFDKEYEDLVYKMKLIMERKKALEVQEELIKNGDDAHRRQKPGTLWLKKKSSGRISLKELCKNQTPGTVSAKLSQQVLEITPKNAKYVHFNCKNNDEKCDSTLCTIDGAVIIPNANNLVSLTEIKSAFEAMPGVDPILLPKKWISNHFKWIVWKLASMERNFPNLFFNSLSIENVMQQLKYRYDIEIERAVRPALRRILENDDIPQKRMILCVSDIIEVSPNIFELKLTDGWYCIQTVIDQALCKQILTSKIVIGTKLIMQSAEILNCEGCHPLEVPNHVRLKINYNCTRRAVWHAKLGYQRIAEAFPIPLRTINPDGGIIAVIKIFIARVYPLRYMERQADKIVWRNKKAEDKREREWAMSKMKEMELIHQKVQEDYEKEMNTAQKNILSKVDCNKVAEISSPKLLYQILENTNDPEGFKNKMSSSQLTSAMEYRSNIYAHHQQEIASRIAKQVNKLKSSSREVTAVLKLRIVDGSESSKDSFIFNIWKPTEEHLEVLKEGSMFSVYNVFPKPNGDLSANSRTHFKPELSSRNNTVQRHLLPISSLQNSVHKPPFNEFDTVGTVVQMHKDDHCQDLWLTDHMGRLLHIKIMEGPEKCCLLDNLSRGQNIAVMNLIFRNPHQIFGQALANQCSTLTGYPQYSFLQNGLTEHCKQLPKDLTSFLNECDKKIETCVASKKQVNRNSTSSLLGLLSTENISDLFDDSSEDTTLIQSRLTTIDVAMSLIDTDQFL